MVPPLWQWKQIPSRVLVIAVMPSLITLSVSIPKTSIQAAL